jgi:putative nucleotidyltransferase with HDIG domain
MTDRPTRFAIAVEAISVAIAIAVAIILAPSARWDLGALAMLQILAVASELSAVRSAARGIKVSGSFLAIVATLVLFGAAPAVALALITILVSWVRERYEPHMLLINLVTYAWFPLITGAAFHAVQVAAGVTDDGSIYYLFALGAFLVALALDFTLIAAYYSYIERSSFWSKVERALLPVLPSELASALMTVVVVYGYASLGTPALAFAAIGIFVFQYLLGAMLVSQQRADELELRAKQLAGFQVALLGALLRTLDLRDRMTARHSAAVARYAREIAQAAGLSEADQEVAHTAGLLHDIGKFVLPDRILKTGAPLSESDWEQVRRHPYEGARIVSQVDGYRAIGDIILAHHERPDGLGYPQGLEGDEIPEISRIISVADVYDVMTARETYREPVNSFEALAELRRVAGTQLDARFVEVFADILSHKDFAYRHGEDADFEAELAIDRRITDLVKATTPAPRTPGAGLAKTARTGI